jgi:ribosomal protein L31E
MAKDFKEKTITVNLRRVFEKPATKRAIAANYALKANVEKETRLSNVKLSNSLNELIWSRGRYNTPRKLTVKIVKDKETARVMLPEEKYEPKQDKKKEAPKQEKDKKEPAKTEAKEEKEKKE